MQQDLSGQQDFNGSHDGVLRRPHPDGEAMSRHLLAKGLLALSARARSDRRARRVLAQELADYGPPAQRDDLQLLIEATDAADDEAARILRSQSQAQLFRGRLAR